MLDLSTSRSKKRTAPLEAECEHGAIGMLYGPIVAATPPLGGVAGGSALRKMHWGMSLVEVAPDKETSLGHPYPFTSGRGVRVVRYDVGPTPGLQGRMCEARLTTPTKQEMWVANW